MRLSLFVQRYEAPLAERARNSRNEWPARSGAILTLTTPDGLVGRGEAAPLPGHSRDTLASDHAELVGLDAAELARWLELGLRSPSELCDALARLPRPATYAARFALETALLELVARRRGEPLHHVLRAAYGLEPAPVGPVPVAALLDPDTALTRAAELLATGFSTLKLKVGLASQEAELAGIAELRRKLGESFRLRLDANRAWSAREARERLEAFASHRIEFIEEPTAPGEHLTAPAIAVALDESLPEAAELSASERAARGVRAWVLKPTLLGGIARTVELARVATQAGLDAIVSHAFEGPIGFAALTELALALAPPLAQGLGPHAALTAWQLPLPAGHRGASLELHDQPGLGLPALRGIPGAA